METVGQVLRDVVLPGLGAVLIVFVLNLARHYVQRIKDERLRQLLFDLVRAAEQIYGPGAGPAKRRYVLGQARKRGYAVLRDEVEAPVHDLNREMMMDEFLDKDKTKAEA